MVVAPPFPPSLEEEVELPATAHPAANPPRPVPEADRGRTGGADAVVAGRGGWTPAREEEAPDGAR